jgi:alkane 1-monooxygenase
MVKAMPFAASFVTALTLLLGLWLGGVFTFLTPVVVFVGLPLLDQLVGEDIADTAAEGAAGSAFNGVLRAWVPIQLIVLAVALWVVASGTLSWLEWTGLLVSTALLTSGGGINSAHELMHRKWSVDKALAEVLMATASYTHFCIEHVHGHHKHVGTPLDPATARLGESVYAFLPRTVVGGLRSAIRIESERNQRREIPWFSWRNRLSRYLILWVASYVAVGAVFGWAALGFYALQAVGAIGFLEVINYVEHYGLMRAETAPGRFEKVQPKHSWNANHRVSNWWLFNLQRHADHHANASRPFYTLRAIEAGAQLPFSYPTMILVALIPPLWHWLMDAHALRHTAT